VVNLSGELSAATLQAAKEAGPSYDKPQFGIKLLLAELNKRNGNGHGLKLDQTRKTLKLLEDRPYVPGDFNHGPDIVATSTKLWIEGEDQEHPRLMLEGVFWNSRLSAE